jgi:hypothetical protein
MPTLKKEEVKQLSEPIIIEAGILGEKEYRVEKITTDMLVDIDKIAKEGKGELDISTKQLAYLLGVADDKEFKGIDLRVITKALRFLMSATVDKVNDAKNPS